MMRTVCTVALLLGIAAGIPGGGEQEFAPSGWMTLQVDHAVVYPHAGPFSHEELILAPNEVCGGHIRVMPGTRAGDRQEVTALLLGEAALDPHNALLQHQLEPIVWRWNVEMKQPFTALGKIANVQTRRALDTNGELEKDPQLLRCWGAASLEMINQGVLPKHIFPQEDGSLVGCRSCGDAAKQAKLSSQLETLLSDTVKSTKDPYFNNLCFTKIMKRKVSVVEVDSLDGRPSWDDVVVEMQEPFNIYSLDVLLQSFYNNWK